MPLEEKVDVIIVGAGPAGSTTAMLLAAAGHDVVLLDRHEFPRAKPCGDCLSAQTGRLLHRLGLLAAVEAERPARLAGWRIVAPDGSMATGGFQRHSDGDPHAAVALALPRERLDAIIAAAAQRAGATLLTRVHVTDLLRDARGRVAGVRGRGPDGQPLALRARLVVGADGLRSIVARRLGLVRPAGRLRKLSLTAHLRGIGGIDGFGEMHLADGACAGLAPVEACPADGGPADTLCNLTLVVDARRFARDVARDAERFFWTAIRRFPRLRDRLDGARLHAGHHFLASGPFDRPTRGVATDGAALVGDAAGYFDPFTGQGVYQALAGAGILAEVAGAALRAGDSSARRLRPYAQRRATLVRSARTVQRIIEFAIARPTLADAAIRRLARAPRATDALIAVTADLRPARSLLAPDVAFSFLIPGLIPETLR